MTTAVMSSRFSCCLQRKMSLPVSEHPQDTVQSLSRSILQVVGHSKNPSFVNNLLAHLQATNPEEAKQHLEQYIWLVLHKQLGIDIPPKVVRGITTLLFKQEVALRNSNVCYEHQHSQNLTEDCIYDEEEEVLNNLSPSLLLHDDIENDFQKTLENGPEMSGLLQACPANPYWPPGETYDSSRCSQDASNLENPSSVLQSNTINQNHEGVFACMEDISLQVLDQGHILGNFDEFGEKKSQNNRADDQFPLEGHIAEVSDEHSSTCLSPTTPLSKIMDSSPTLSSHNYLENNEVLSSVDDPQENGFSTALASIRKDETGDISHCIDKAMILLAGTTQNGMELSHVKSDKNKDSKKKFRDFKVHNDYLQDTSEIDEIQELSSHIEKGVAALNCKPSSLMKREKLLESEQLSGQNNELLISIAPQGKDIPDDNVAGISSPKLSSNVPQTPEECLLRPDLKNMQEKEISLADEEIALLEDAHNKSLDSKAMDHSNYSSTKYLQCLEENASDVTIVQCINAAMAMLRETNETEEQLLSPMYNNSFSFTRGLKSENISNDDEHDFEGFIPQLNKLSHNGIIKGHCNLSDNSPLSNEPHPSQNKPDIDGMNENIYHRTCDEDLLHFAKGQRRGIPIRATIDMAIEMLSQSQPSLVEESTHEMTGNVLPEETLQDDCMHLGVPEDMVSDGSQSSEIFHRALVALNDEDLDCSFDIPLKADTLRLEPPEKKIKKSITPQKVTNQNKHKNSNALCSSEVGAVDVPLSVRDESEDLIIISDTSTGSNQELGSRKLEADPSFTSLDDSEDLQIIFDSNVDNGQNISSNYVDVVSEAVLHDGPEQKNNQATTNKETCNNCNAEDASSTTHLPSVASAACKEIEQSRGEIRTSSLDNDDPIFNSNTWANCKLKNMEASNFQHSSVLKEMKVGSSGMNSLNVLQNDYAGYESPSRPLEDSNASSQKNLEEHNKIAGLNEAELQMPNLPSFVSDDDHRSNTRPSLTNSAIQLPDYEQSQDNIPEENEYMDDFDSSILDNLIELDTSDIHLSDFESLDSLDTSAVEEQEEAPPDNGEMDNVVSNSALPNYVEKEAVSDAKKGIDDLTATFVEHEPLLTSSPRTSEYRTVVPRTKEFPLNEKVVVALNPELLTLTADPTPTKKYSEERACHGEKSEYEESDEDNSESLLRGIEYNDILHFSVSMGYTPLEYRSFEDEASTFNSHHYDEELVETRTARDMAQSFSSPADREKIPGLNTGGENESHENVEIRKETHSPHTYLAEYETFISQYENKTKKSSNDSTMSLQEVDVSSEENDDTEKKNPSSEKTVNSDLNMDRDLRSESPLTISSGKEQNDDNKTMNSKRDKGILRKSLKFERSESEAYGPNESCEEWNISSCNNNEAKGEVENNHQEKIIREAQLPSFCSDWTASSSSVLESYHSTFSANDQSDIVHRSEGNRDSYINSQSDIFPVDVAANTSTVNPSSANNDKNSYPVKKSSSTKGITCDSDKDKMSRLELRLSQYIETICIDRNPPSERAETTDANESVNLAQINGEDLDICSANELTETGYARSGKKDSVNNLKDTHRGQIISKATSTSQDKTTQETSFKEKRHIRDLVDDVTAHSECLPACETDELNQLTIEKEFLENLVNDHFPVTFFQQGDKLNDTLWSENGVINGELPDCPWEDDEMNLDLFLLGENEKQSDTKSKSEMGDTMKNNYDNRCLQPPTKQVLYTLEPGKKEKSSKSYSINNHNRQLRQMPSTHDKDSPMYKRGLKSSQRQPDAVGLLPIENNNLHVKDKSTQPLDRKAAPRFSKNSRKEIRSRSDDKTEGKALVPYRRENRGLPKNHLPSNKPPTSEGAGSRGSQEKDLKLKKCSTVEGAENKHVADSVPVVQDDSDTEIMDWEYSTTQTVNSPMQTEESLIEDDNEITVKSDKENTTTADVECMLWE
ncbi:tanabin-like [Macrobrachium rosenbergii]|uniref:tanabin-like n=1 Tax=Macrobrachium rosenbergii TaxID=79674 RepID=UPI0034D6F2E5